MLYQSGTVRVNGGAIGTYTDPFNVDIITEVFNPLSGVNGLAFSAYNTYDHPSRGIALDVNHSPINVTGWNPSLLDTPFTFEVLYFPRDNTRHDIFQLGQFLLDDDSDGNIYCFYKGTWYFFVGSGVIDSWNHIAIQFNSEIQIYWNGQRRSLNTFSGSYQNFYLIGGAYVSNGYANALIQCVFYPYAKYAQNFTPPSGSIVPRYRAIVWR